MDLFNKKAFAHLVTFMADGKPQVTPVWVDYDGRHVIINTAEGRLKDKNMQRDPRVALSITDPDNPTAISRCAVAWWSAPTRAPMQHIDAMAKKYLGQDKYPFRQPGRGARDLQGGAGALHLDVRRARWSDGRSWLPGSGSAARGGYSR